MPVLHVEQEKLPMRFRAGQEVHLKDYATSFVYKVLTADVEQSPAGIHTLCMIVRVTNEGSMTTGFRDSSFRLLVDDVPRAPTGNLNDLVDTHSAKEGTIIFANCHASRRGRHLVPSFLVFRHLRHILLAIHG